MENAQNNSLILSGEVATAPEFSHESHGCDFYTFKLLTQRLSGTYDEINVLIKKSLVNTLNPQPGDFLSIQSELRSFNRKTDSGNRLIISAFAKEVSPCEAGVFKNELELIGTICKEPIYRKTPLGREICDIMLATNRNYGRSDYLPVVVWGRNARSAAEFKTGDLVTVFGRIQSREYTKLCDGVPHIKTTYEVSAASIEPAEI
ncbi:MAG: single-stranded DNA-binding protein [Oscillospiraceae bacterium]|nr:single-stranded DNA-binding protein [Oscillospiraceae bacterium]